MGHGDQRLTRIFQVIRHIHIAAVGVERDRLGDSEISPHAADAAPPEPHAHLFGPVVQNLILIRGVGPIPIAVALPHQVVPQQSAVGVGPALFGRVALPAGPFEEGDDSAQAWLDHQGQVPVGQQQFRLGIGVQVFLLHHRLVRLLLGEAIGGQGGLGARRGFGRRLR